MAPQNTKLLNQANTRAKEIVAKTTQKLEGLSQAEKILRF